MPLLRPFISSLFKYLRYLLVLPQAFVKRFYCAARPRRSKVRRRLRNSFLSGSLTTALGGRFVLKSLDLRVESLQKCCGGVPPHPEFVSGVVRHTGQQLQSYCSLGMSKARGSVASRCDKHVGSKCLLEKLECLSPIIQSNNNLPAIYDTYLCFLRFTHCRKILHEFFHLVLWQHRILITTNNQWNRRVINVDG